MSDLFGLCPKCELPIFVDSNITFCPYCTALLPDDDSDFAEDSLGNFIDWIKKQSYFEWDDIQRLIHIADTLIAINTRVSIELGKSLVELHKAKAQIEFYRKATTFRIK